ncbi:MAG TPA: tripartite tricarboxylate transporter substrate binding protein [Casimicrobiaceae bacterium]|nr:tripartite tricarboxylate transporter substrate binding protein [Casimicrobiaceae bacterium]
MKPRHAGLLGVRLLLALVIAAVATASSGVTNEPAIGAKPIHMIVATVPGVPPDVVARILAERLEPLLHQPVIVENRPGAIGSIGLAAVSHAAPDGSTLGVIAMPYVVAPSLIHVPYDLERDFTPVTLVTHAYAMLAVRSDSPVRTVADLIARARARPGAVTFASTGNGTPSHLAASLLQRETGTRMLHIPYKGNAAVAGLLGGDVDFMMTSPFALWPHVKAGKLRVLATTAPKRLDAYPDVPTLAELGYPDVQITDWQGILAPPGTPPEIVAKLRNALVTVLSMSDVRQKLETMGLEAATSEPDEFARLIASEIRRWNAVVRDTGMKAD